MPRHALKPCKPSMAIAALALGAASLALVAPAAPAVSTPSTNFCSQTAAIQRNVCSLDASDNSLVTQAACINITDPQARSACRDEQRAAYADDLALCSAQAKARKSVCGELGEDRYDPPIDPANFVDPLQIGHAIAPNPYLILVPGYTRNYRSSEERIAVRVTSDVIEILGVRCIVVRDTVRNPGGEVTEDTYDYFAQDLAGNVWYFGEHTQEFEDGLSVNMDGTFKAGEDNAKPGVGIQAVPVVGTTYREEYTPGEAEDLATVLSVTASATAPAANCTHTCLQTRNFTPTEPGNVENKFYAPGIGEIRSFAVSNPDDPEVLVSYHY